SLRTWYSNPLAVVATPGFCALSTRNFKLSCLCLSASADGEGPQPDSPNATSTTVREKIPSFFMTFTLLFGVDGRSRHSTDFNAQQPGGRDARKPENGAPEQCLDSLTKIFYSAEA